MPGGSESVENFGEKKEGKDLSEALINLNTESNATLEAIFIYVGNYYKNCNKYGLMVQDILRLYVKV